MSIVSCLIIDDVPEALGLMTDLGRKVASESAQRLRNSIIDYARRCGWAVVPYNVYAEWAKELLTADDGTWVILDPLFPIDTSDHRQIFARVSRGRELGQFEFDARAQINERSLSNSVTALDDAADSGLTLRFAGKMVVEHGRQPSRLVVCASSDAARSLVARTFRGVDWRTYMQGSWNVIHLRDGCPFLPFVGRQADHQPLANADGTQLGVRVHPRTRFGHMWYVLNLDSQVRQAIHFAYLDVATRLAEVLGRPATVGDLRFLGAAVCASVQPGQLTTIGQSLVTLTPAP